MPQYLPVVGVRPGPAGRSWQPTKAKRLITKFLGAFPVLRSKDMEAVLIVAGLDALTDPDVEILVIPDNELKPSLQHKAGNCGLVPLYNLHSSTMLWRDRKWQGTDVTHYGGYTLYSLRR